MKLLDLGDLDAPVLLFGGPYSNLHSLEAVLRVAETRGIPASHVICTGDVVAYCAHAAETVARVRGFGCAVVAGNCEKQLAAYEDTCGCGFDAGSTCDLLSAGWYAHANRSVGAEDRMWMGNLPDIVQFRHQGQVCAVIHGGLSNVSRFLWSVSDEAEFLEEISHIQKLIPDVSCVIAGHCGVEFRRNVNEVSWINAGVIGMPPNDGACQTRYVILEDGAVTFHKLEYDAPAAAQAMSEAGLVQGYHTSLLSGYWPSEDVLPDQLRVGSLAKG